MSHTAIRIAAALTGLATLCLAAAPGPAEAAQPRRNTTYRADGFQDDIQTSYHVTVKVGSSGTIKKAVVKLQCPAGTSKATFKNVEVDAGGNAYKELYFPGTQIPKYTFFGTFDSRHKLRGNFDPAEDIGEPCESYVVYFVAKG